MREKTVLIIDDEVRMADSLRDLLQETGYTAQAAYGGQEGIECLRRETFKVVVTDLRMKSVDGLAVIRYLYENYPGTLIIVITGHATTDSAIDAVHYQVFDYLRKPFDFDMFRRVIEKAFLKIETDELRQDTAAMLTHDIKIPLTSIIGFASMLYDRERQEFHPRARDFSEAIQANGQKILSLIDNYLTTCKIESGTLLADTGPVEMESMVKDLIESILPEANRRNKVIQYTIEPIPGPVILDEVLVYRALGNLLYNAIKYCVGEAPIHLRVRVLPAEKSPLNKQSLCLEVHNRSDELAMADMSDIFQRYQRSTSASGMAGSGLGLYVVQAVAKAHGGQALAESSEDGWVRFSMMLPHKSAGEVSS